MKKLLLSALLFGGLVSQANAQLEDGSIAPNFTVTAYQPWLSTAGANGNGTYTLYDYLDQGYTVILDVSATWCGPCWNYHLTGALDDAYINHGPAGYPGVSENTTDKLMVIWIEGDGTTADATMLDGQGAIGNWIEPNSTLGQIKFPMANPPSALANQINNGYEITYFPTVYRICPNRMVTEIGSASAAAIVSGLGACPAPASEPVDVVALSYDADTYICTGGNHTPKVTIQNNGLSNLTSATVTVTQGANVVSTGTFTGDLATYGVATVTCTPISNPTSGEMVVTVTSEGDAVLSNGVINTALTIYSAANAPLVQNFSSDAFPYSQYKVSSPTGKNWTYSSGTMKYDCYSYTSGSTGDLFIAPVNLSNVAEPGLSFDVAYRGYSAASPENDKLQVFVSSNCGTTWTSVYDKQGTNLSTGATQTAAFTPSSAADWRRETVSLAAVAGQSEVFVKFVGTSNYGNNIYIDNINISSVANVEESQMSNISVFPNPATESVNVMFEAIGSEFQVNLMDITGRLMNSQVLSGVSGTQTVTFPVSNLAKGSYIVKISGEGYSSTRNVVVK
jgi:hypothetical protein